MGGDRRSPPRSRSRGDGEGKLKGSNVGSNTPVISPIPPTVLEPKLKGSNVGSNTVGGIGDMTGVKVKSSGANVKVQNGRSFAKGSSIAKSDSSNIPDSEKIQEPNVEFLGNPDPEIVEEKTNCITNTGDDLSSEGDLDRERHDSVNLEIHCNNNPGNSQIEGAILEEEDVQEGGRDLTMFMDGREDMNHSDINYTKELPTGMIVNVLNPMFIKDNDSTHLDGDCEMMLNGEEDSCINQNSGIQVNMPADKHISNWSRTEAVRQVGCEGTLNENGRSNENGALGYDYPRNVGNKESNMKKVNERTGAANAWKKPIHVQVD